MTAAIPQTLADRPQWVVWRLENREGASKPTKVPYRAAAPRMQASTADPVTWGTYAEAVEAATGDSSIDGIGFVFTGEDGFAGIDFDDCVKDGQVDPFVAKLVAQLDSYTEISPSGTGLHTIVAATVKGGRNKTGDTPWGGAFENYDRGRFFCVTGWHLEGAPTVVNNRQAEQDAIRAEMFPLKQTAPREAAVGAGFDGTDLALLDRARAARNGYDFDRLYRGEHDRASQSEADLAFCSHLVFWCAGDPDRIDRLFRGSELMRPKWDERRGDATYGAQTIATAFAGHTGGYYGDHTAGAARDDSQQPAGETPPSEPIVFETIEAFAATDEVGASALLGDQDDALIAANSDVLAYGDGGAGKTTLMNDLGCHFAAGKDWLGIPIPQPVRVCIIENEGPRPLLRRKLGRKVDGWTGPPLEGRISILTDPWGKFTFNDAAWRAALASKIAEHEIDVLIAGPVTRLGMNDAGTLQQVRDFVGLGDDLRRLSGRPLTIILIHHENKGGTVSGAWEGSGDTLLHVSARGNGFTSLHIQKARWSSTHHGTTLELAWAAGEGFVLKAARDLHAEILALLGDDEWRTVSEIANPTDHKDKDHKAKPGVGSNREDVLKVLTGHSDEFQSCTGEYAKLVGRSPTAILWKLA